MRVGEDVASCLVHSFKMTDCNNARQIIICMGKQGRKERTTGVLAVAWADC